MRVVAARKRSAISLPAPATRPQSVALFVSGSPPARRAIVDRIPGPCGKDNRTYLATSTLIHSSNDGDPNLHADFGFGVERLPDPTKTASIFFSYFYYPEVTGKISVPPGAPAASLRYKFENYTAGGTLGVPNTPVFLTAGIVADHYLRKQNAAADATHFSIQLGIGAHL